MSFIPSPSAAEINKGSSVLFTNSSTYSNLEPWFSYSAISILLNMNMIGTSNISQISSNKLNLWSKVYPQVSEASKINKIDVKSINATDVSVTIEVLSKSGEIQQLSSTFSTNGDFTNQDGSAGFLG